MIDELQNSNLIYEALNNSDGTSPHSMDRKEDIIGLNRNNSHWMPGLVLLLNTVNPEECDIIAAI